ncbi:GNAT family N-acetyltransferase [Liquorilactobacillus satsumensis]|uniref:N-acetyltransferase domain-containing protein n=1 Tax=Liquorilactobacillus satsumensis DSM 16230 = JCM 12392 TaxID=1423801 RepID=A0A0R1UUS0_9LACO|nr:hypothetical protein FD50_GL001850 [Liquorilactobacillus satsumensis DSM 16230 = JCM 12392]MCC7667798.1 N-acetyltransferase [Liquorilactobacillus satsumensis]
MFAVNNEDILLRRVVQSDVGALFRYSSQKEVAAAAGFKRANNQADALSFMHFLDNDFSWVIEEQKKKQVIGNICLYEGSNAAGEPVTTTRTLGYALNKDYWNQGIMTLALKQLLKTLPPGTVKTIEAFVALDNPASARVLEKNGFVCQDVITLPFWKNFAQQERACVYRRDFTG